MSRPIVFLSYSHDSDAHRERVLALSERLRADGFETRLDRYINGSPPEGWPRWMLNQLDAAAFVLVVCTEAYYRRFRGHEEPGKGKGADWEGALISNELYEARCQTVKFVPVIFAPEDAAFVPEPLHGLTRYPVDGVAQYETLCDFLSGQAGIEPGALGQFQPAPRRRGQPLVFDEGNLPAAPSGLANAVAQRIGRDAGGVVKHLRDYFPDLATLCRRPKTAILRWVGDAAGGLSRPVIFVVVSVAIGFVLQLPQLGKEAHVAVLVASMAVFKVVALQLFAAIIYLLFRMVGGRGSFVATFSTYLYIVSPLYLALLILEIAAIGILRAYDPALGAAAQLDAVHLDAQQIQTFVTTAPGLAISFALLFCARVVLLLGWFIACWGAFRQLHSVVRWRSTLAGIATLIAGIIFSWVLKYIALGMFNASAPPLR